MGINDSISMISVNSKGVDQHGQIGDEVGVYESDRECRVKVEQEIMLFTKKIDRFCQLEFNIMKTKGLL